MEPKFELGRFRDKRVKLLIRFSENSNFWFEDGKTATWVPTLQDAEDLYEYLKIVNEWNEFKKIKGE